MKKKCYLSNEDILAKFEDPQAFLAAVDALVEAKYSNLPPKQKNSIKAFVKNEKLQQIWEALNVQIKILDDLSSYKKTRKSLFSERAWL